MSDEKKPSRYKWPWFVLAAFVLFVILTILWVSAAVHREEQERNFHNPPAAH